MRKFDQLIEQKLKLYEAIAPPAPIMPRKPNDPADPTAGTSAVPDINALKAPVATTAPAAGTATPTAGVTPTAPAPVNATAGTQAVPAPVQKQESTYATTPKGATVDDKNLPDILDQIKKNPNLQKILADYVAKQSTTPASTINTVPTVGQ